MSPEFSPQAGLYTPEDLARLRETARARAFEAARLEGASVKPPTLQPTSGAIRVPNSVKPTPRAADQAIPATVQREKVAEQSFSKEKSPRRRSTPAQKGFAMVAILGAGLFGAKQFGIFNPAEIINHTTGSNISNNQPATSTYGEIQLPTAASAEGLNIENCKRPGSVISTIMVSGEYALRYQLQTADGAVVVPAPYMATGQLSTGKGQDPANAKFETKSGYPEMTIHDLALEIHACQKPNTAAVTQENGVETINFSNIDFSATLALPSEYKHPIQDQAYMPSLANDTLYTWPAQTFLTPNAKLFTDASVQAAKTAHVSPDQQVGAFNTAVKAILANATDAAPTSSFNQVMTYIDPNTETIYDAVKEGLKIRLGDQKLNWNGTIESFNPALSDKKPALLDMTARPEDSFAVKSGEIIVGQYASLHQEGQGK